MFAIHYPIRYWEAGDLGVPLFFRLSPWINPRYQAKIKLNKCCGLRYYR